jgi:hypothetical protein
MSDIDRLTKAPAQSAAVGEQIEKLDGGFNPVPRPSESDLADGRSAKPRSPVTVFPAKPAPSAGRAPFFGR